MMNVTTSPEWGNIAHQGKGSLYGGNHHTSANNLLILIQTPNMQSAQEIISRTLPPDLSVGRNLLKTFQSPNSGLAQKVIKTNLSSDSAKLLAQQSAKYLANQSGEYFPNLKRGEFTPFVKGDFSHLSKIGKSRYLNSFISKNGEIEFCESIKGKIIEFSDSIKKGSYLATRFRQLCQYSDYIEPVQYFQSSAGGWDLMSVRNTYAVQHSNHVNNVHEVQPFGSMPNRSNSFRPRVFSQLAKLMFDSFAAASNCSLSSGVMRILNCGDCPSPLGLLSRLTVDKWSPIRLISISIGGHLNTVKPIKSTPPNNATNTIRGLTTTNNTSIEVAMQDINTPVTGRTSFTPNQTQFKFLFLSIKRSDTTAKPCRITVTAPNENSARMLLARDYVLSFAGRVPVQEVAHA